MEPDLFNVKFDQIRLKIVTFDRSFFGMQKSQIHLCAVQLKRSLSGWNTVFQLCYACLESCINRGYPINLTDKLFLEKRLCSNKSHVGYSGYLQVIASFVQITFP